MFVILNEHQGKNEKGSFVLWITMNSSASNWLSISFHPSERIGRWYQFSFNMYQRFIQHDTVQLVVYFKYHQVNHQFSPYFESVNNDDSLFSFFIFFFFKDNWKPKSADWLRILHILRLVRKLCQSSLISCLRQLKFSNSLIKNSTALAANVTNILEKT